MGWAVAQGYSISLSCMRFWVQSLVSQKIKKIKGNWRPTEIHGNKHKVRDISNDREKILNFKNKKDMKNIILE